ncbi:hypothetical protein [Sphingopyxis granuli]|uniref:hypothetical protein n=1 Tax=Sphingopyxis granuli TaxID=267128 RepID=UPI001BAF5640|nr:hypothetical protein [Sphingopyxis granuli]QUM72169.1 hypothetical protein ICN83_18055 [Sphingopyxis granuli]
MSKSADRARKCFELAARGSTNGERSEALRRGLAIVERYDLDPDAFDIPGRERRASGLSSEQVDAIVDDVFERRMREDRWKARVNAHERGRERFTVFRNDMA